MTELYITSPYLVYAFENDNMTGYFLWGRQFWLTYLRKAIEQPECQHYHDQTLKMPRQWKTLGIPITNKG